MSAVAENLIMLGHFVGLALKEFIVNLKFFLIRCAFTEYEPFPWLEAVKLPINWFIWINLRTITPLRCVFTIADVADVIYPCQMCYLWDSVHRYWPKPKGQSDWSWAFSLAVCPQPVITCSKLTIETLEKGVKCIQS